MNQRYIQNIQEMRSSNLKHEYNFIDIKLNIEDDESPQPEVFISYCWKNSREAIANGSTTTELGLGWLDPRKLGDYFKANGITAWVCFI